MATIYEFRVYNLHSGQLEAFKRRFGSASVPLFAKHKVLDVNLRGMFLCCQAVSGRM